MISVKDTTKQRFIFKFGDVLTSLTILDHLIITSKRMNIYKRIYFQLDLIFKHNLM